MLLLCSLCLVIVSELLGYNLLYIIPSIHVLLAFFMHIRLQPATVALSNTPLHAPQVSFSERLSFKS